MLNRVTEERKSYHRESPERRREDLIQAALDVIASNGPEAATVRAIAARANVTQSLIRHYFSSKEELICQAFEHHMSGMVQHAKDQARILGGSAQDQLAMYIATSLRSPVKSSKAVAVWAAFLQIAGRDERMNGVHQRTYLLYRETIETLIRAVLAQNGEQVSDRHLRQLATTCHALIDGFWIEASMLPHEFPPEDDMISDCLDGIGKILGVDLKTTHP